MCFCLVFCLCPSVCVSVYIYLFCLFLSGVCLFVYFLHYCLCFSLLSVFVSFSLCRFFLCLSVFVLFLFVYVFRLYFSVYLLFICLFVCMSVCVPVCVLWLRCWHSYPPISLPNTLQLPGNATQRLKYYICYLEGRKKEPRWSTITVWSILFHTPHFRITRGNEREVVFFLYIHQNRFIYERNQMRNIVVFWKWDENSELIRLCWEKTN